MPVTERVGYLLEELSRWHAMGLIDEVTHERIVRLYAPVPEDRFEADLEREAALHKEVERHVEETARAEQQAAVAARALPAEREERVWPAISETARDVASFPPEPPEPHPAVAVLDREDRWSRYVRPFLYENALWIAGWLLVVFGSLYFLGLVWDDLDSVLLHVVIAGALHAYAALFFLTGYVVGRRRDAHGVGRTLFAFATALLPLGSVAAGELCVLLSAHPVVVAMVFAGTIGVQAAMVAVMTGLYERAAISSVVETTAGLCFATLLAPLLPAYGAPWAGLLVLAFAFAALARGLLNGSKRVNLRMSVIFGGASLLLAFAVLVVRVAATLDIPPTSYAPLVAAVGALLVLCDHRLRLRAGGEPRLTAIGLSLHAVVALAFAASLAGLFQQGYFDLGARIAVMGSATIATWVFARAAWLHGRRIMTWIAAGAGLFAYFFLPSPFLGLMRLVESWAAGALGYADQPLPVAYYGLVFAPYLGLLAALAVAAFRRRRPDLGRDLSGFCLVVGAVAAALGATSTADLRPILFTWPLYAAGAMGLARLLRRDYPAHAAQMLLVASALALGIYFEDARLTLLALSLHAAAALLVAWRRPLAPAFSGVALAATAALALGAMLFPLWAPLYAALLLVAAAWLARGVLLAFIATLGVAAAVASLVETILPGSTTPVLAAVACIALAVTVFRRDVPKARAVRAASLAVATCGLAGSLLQSQPGLPQASWWGFAAAAGAVLYAAVAIGVYHAEKPGRAGTVMTVLAIAAVAALAFLIEAVVPLGFEDRMWIHFAALAAASLAWSGAARFGGASWLGQHARGIAFSLALLSAIPPAVAVLLMGCGIPAGDPRWAVVAALLSLAALHDGRRRTDGFHLSVLLVVALPALVWGVCGLGGPSAPLALVALALGLADARRRKLFGRAPGLGWPVAVAGVAVVLSRGRFDRLELCGSMLALALILGAAWTARRTRRLATWTAASALAALQLAILWTAIATSTGRYPAESVFALLGAGMLGGAVVLSGFRSFAGVGRAAVLLAMVEGAASIVLTASPGTPEPIALVALGTLALGVVSLVRIGLVEEQVWMLYVAGLAAPISWTLMRWQLVTGSGAGLDVAVLLVAAHAAFWLGRTAPESVATRPLAAFARLWPVLLVPLLVRLGSAGATVSAALAAVHFGAMSEVAPDKHLRVPAALFANGAVTIAFAGAGVGDPLAYGIPVALSLLFLVHTYSDELGTSGRNGLRTLVLLCIYGLAVGTALSRLDPVRSLLLVPLICVAGAVAGAMLRVRVYLTLGVAFLAGDLLLNLVRYGLMSRPLGALFLTALGLCLVAAMVAFSLERERILRRYSLILGELKTWD